VWDNVAFCRIGERFVKKLLCWQYWILIEQLFWAEFCLVNSLCEQSSDWWAASVCRVMIRDSFWGQSSDDEQYTVFCVSWLNSFSVLSSDWWPASMGIVLIGEQLLCAEFWLVSSSRVQSSDWWAASVCRVLIGEQLSVQSLYQRTHLRLPILSIDRRQSSVFCTITSKYSIPVRTLYNTACYNGWKGQ